MTEDQPILVSKPNIGSIITAIVLITGGSFFIYSFGIKATAINKAYNQFGFIHGLVMFLSGMLIAYGLSRYSVKLYKDRLEISNSRGKKPYTIWLNDINSMEEQGSGWIGNSKNKRIVLFTNGKEVASIRYNMISNYDDFQDSLDGLIGKKEAANASTITDEDVKFDSPVFTKIQQHIFGNWLLIIAAASIIVILIACLISDSH